MPDKPARLLYVDTSALIKWYLEEPFSSAFEEFISGHPGACISRLTAVEMRCALARRRRNGEITKSYEESAFRAFESDARAGYLRVLPVNDDCTVNALALIERLRAIPLRTLDALHLALAQGARMKALATADKTMAEASRALGLETFSFF